MLKNDHSCIFGKIEREMFWVLRVPFFSFFFPPITDFTSLEICEILRYADLLLSWFSSQFYQKQLDMIISLEDCLRIPPNTSLAHPHTSLICPLLLQLYIAEDFKYGVISSHVFKSDSKTDLMIWLITTGQCPCCQYIQKHSKNVLTVKLHLFWKKWIFYLLLNLDFAKNVTRRRQLSCFWMKLVIIWRARYLLT